MAITTYISVNLLLFSSWYFFLYRIKGSLSFTDRLIGTFILGLTQIIATQMLLGVVFRQLYAGPLYILNILLSLIVLFLSIRNNSGQGACSEIRDSFTGFLHIIWSDKILLCIFALFSLSVCRLVFSGYLFPSYSWDALYYHLPTVGQILQSGSIEENSTPSFIQQYINLFSKNINLFFVWNIIFLKSDRIVDLSQLCFTIAGVLSIYSMAIKLKIREKYALYASLLFFFTPVLILQSTVNYVDGAVSMLFLIALNFLIYDDIRNADLKSGTGNVLKEDKIRILLSGLAAGILLGSKPTGPVFIAVIFIAVFIREIVRAFYQVTPAASSKNCILRESLPAWLVYFVLPVFLTGGYWYMRNWILHGNPVYYMDVSIFNFTIFKGMKSDWVEPSPRIIEGLNYVTRMFHVWLERVSYYMYDSRLSGFGPIWFILFLPGIVVSLIQACRTKKYSFLFIAGILLAAFLIHPRNWTTRYVMFVVGLGALSFGAAFDHFHKRESVIKTIALALAAYTFMTVNSPCIMPDKIREFLALPAHERTLSRHKPFNIDIKVRNEYGYWIWIENNIIKGDTLAYTFESFDLDTARPFFTAPLWNSEFSNRVVYIKADTYQEWLQGLNSNNADYILIRKDSIEDKWIGKERKLFYSLRWMGNMTEKFRIVYADENYKVVRYTKSGG